MPQTSGIYDSYFIQPVAKVKENLSIWTVNKYTHYVIEYQEPMPPGPATTRDIVNLAAQANLPAVGTIQKRVVDILQLNDLEFLHIRFEPLDNVIGLIWEQGGQQKFGTARAVHAQVDINTRLRDPALATTTVFILGSQRDMQLEVRNPMNYAIPQARFIFWGNRMILRERVFNFTGISDAERTAAIKGLDSGDVDMVRKYVGTTTYVPAEGRSS